MPGFQLHRQRFRSGPRRAAPAATGDVFRIAGIAGIAGAAAGGPRRREGAGRVGPLPLGTLLAAVIRSRRFRTRTPLTATALAAGLTAAGATTAPDGH